MLLCTGCSTTEVRDRSFVQAIGVSGKQTQTVTVFPFDGEDASFGTGVTMMAAIGAAEASQEKRLFLGHTELLVTGSGPLRSRLRDLFVGASISPGCKLLFVPDDALAEQTVQAPLPVLESMQRKGKLLVPTCAEVLDQLLGRGEKALVPCLADEDYRMAVVTAEGEPCAVLDARACQGVCWLSGLSEPRMVSVTVDDQPVDFSLRHVRKKTSVQIENGRLSFSLSLTLSGSAMQSCDPSALESALQEEISALCKAAVEQAVHAGGADLLEAAKAVEREDPAFFANHAADWDALLRTLSFSCTVHVRA